MAATAPLLTLTDTTIDSYLASATIPTLIDFWAPWCGPCKTLAPVLQSITETTSTISVATINVDSNPATVAKYGISSIPTMLLVHNGEVVKQIVGARDKTTLLAELGLDPA